MISRVIAFAVNYGRAAQVFARVADRIVVSFNSGKSCNERSIISCARRVSRCFISGVSRIGMAQTAAVI